MGKGAHSNQVKLFQNSVGSVDLALFARLVEPSIEGWFRRCLSMVFSSSFFTPLRPRSFFFLGKLV